MSHSLAPVLQRQFEQTLTKIGIWTLYTRSDHRFLCQRCYSLDTRDAPADCPACFGTGFQTQLERWFVYHSNGLERARPTPATLGKPGWTNEMPAFFFTRASEVPVIGDRFFLVEWNQSRDRVKEMAAQPTRLVQALRITFVEPNIAGEVIFYTAHCQYVTEALDQYRTALMQTPVRVTRG